ncbi:MAG: NAD kinase [Pseudomonadota bacterium]
MKYKNIAIIANDTESSLDRLRQIQSKYNFIELSKEPTSINKIDLIIVLGGDGFMLHCLHSYMHLNIPIYGINCGTVGFLLNHFDIENILEKLEKAEITVTYPLEMRANLINGQIKTYLAINEVSLFRSTNQAVKIQINIDGNARLEELVCDGILLATPAGSSAYNSSVHGPILPIGSNILALTPISPFRPKRWAGAILPNTANIELIILDHENRPVNAVADFIEVKHVKSVIIREKRDKPIRLLFDKNHSLEDRIIKEQFAY